MWIVSYRGGVASNAVALIRCVCPTHPFGLSSVPLSLAARRHTHGFHGVCCGFQRHVRHCGPASVAGARYHAPSTPEVQTLSLPSSSE